MIALKKRRSFDEESRCARQTCGKKIPASRQRPQLNASHAFGARAALRERFL
jgi:hypothetical protein